VPAEVAIWEDDTGSLHEWGGRAVIEAGHSLISEIGGTCAIRWPVPGGIMVGAFVLGGGQVGNAGESYRLQGTAGLTLVADS
jgi:hypothetical protein